MKKCGSLMKADLVLIPIPILNDAIEFFRTPPLRTYFNRLTQARL